MTLIIFNIRIYLVFISVFIFNIFIYSQNDSIADKFYNIAKESRSNDSAITFYRKASDLYECNKNYEKQINSLFKLSEHYIDESNYDSAFINVSKIQKLVHSYFPDSLYLVYKNNELWAYYYTSLKQLDSAKSYYRRAINQLYKLKDSIEIAKNYLKYGNIFYDEFEFDSAGLYYNKGLIYIRNYPSNPCYAKLIHSIGNIYYMKGNYDEAILQLNKADSLNNIYNYLSPYSAITLRVFEAFILVSRSNYNQALEILKEIEPTILTELSDKYLLITTFFNKIGNCYFINYEYEKALQYYFRAIDILEKQYNDAEIYLNTCVYIADVYRDMRNEKAMEYYMKAIQISKNIDYFPVHNIYYQCGYLYYLNNDFKNAEKFYLKAIEDLILRYGKDNPYIGSIYIYLGNVYLITGREETGLKTMRNGFEISKKYYSNNDLDYKYYYTYLGDYYISNQLFTRALKNYQKALYNFICISEPIDIHAIPSLEDIKLFPEIEQTLQKRAITYFELYKYENNIEYLKYSMDNLLLAIQYIQYNQRNCTIGKDKLFFSNRMYPVYHNALNVAYELYTITQDEEYVRKAFEISEQSKAAVLFASIRENEAKINADIPDSLIKKENKINQRIADLNSQLYAMKEDAEQDQNKISAIQQELFNKEIEKEDLIKYFEKKYFDYYKLKYRLALADIKNIQNNISEDKSIIEYTVTDTFLYCLFISKDNIRINRQIINTDFYELINSYRLSLYSKSFIKEPDKAYKDFLENSYKLYAILIQPFEGYVLNKSLVIIPDPVLANIPFESLICNFPADTDFINYSKLDYLITKCDINYSYSASLSINKNKKLNLIGYRLYAFAPTYQHVAEIEDTSIFVLRESREYLKPIPGVIEEVKGITKYIKGKLFINYDAIENNFKSVIRKNRILHLAMHTIIDEEDPMYSSLAFTINADSVEDGFLNTYEIYNLKFNSPLTVLSACKTGFGKLERGEGIMSLARGFFYAGCPSIVMTLWSVEDISSSQLMPLFYKYLSKGKSKPHALRLAKLEYLKNADPLKAHPFFWAGYVNIGDPSAIRGNNFYWYILILVCAILGILILIRKRKIFKSS